MDFSLTDDHLALQDAVRAFAMASIPRICGATPRTRHWPRSVGMASPNWACWACAWRPIGGSGHGAVEVMLVAQELGRALGGGAFSRAACRLLGDRLGRQREQQSHGSKPWQWASRCWHSPLAKPRRATTSRVGCARH